MMEHHGRGYTYSIQYHLVWCTKQRQDLLHNDIENTLKQSLLKIASDNTFTILEMHLSGDHVHLLIDCSPQHVLSSLIKALKGASSRIVFKNHPELRDVLTDGSLWNTTYYVGTDSDTTDAQIHRYINDLKKE